MKDLRQSRPDYGFGFQVKVLKTFQGVPSLLGSGQGQRGERAWFLGQQSRDGGPGMRL